MRFLQGEEGYRESGVLKGYVPNNPPARGQRILKQTSGVDLISVLTEAISQLQNADFIGAFESQESAEKELTTTFNPNFSSVDGLFFINGLPEISGFKESATGIGENNLAASVQVYPNPAKDVMNISLKGFLTLQGLGTLLTTEGRPVKTFEIKNNLTNVDVSDLQPGLYVLKIESAESMFLIRVVIQ